MIQVVGHIAIRVPDRTVDGHTDQAVDLDDDAGFFEAFALGCRRNRFGRLHDPLHRSPGSVVRATHQQHLFGLVERPQNHGGDPRHPQRMIADFGAQREDEIWSRHETRLKLLDSPS